MSSIINPNLWLRPTRKHVFFLREGSVEDKDLLGLKGSRLCEMYRMNLPVPYAFTLSTALCTNYVNNGGVMAKEWMDEIRYGIAKLEAKTGKKFGGIEGMVADRQPLLLSIRSGATKEMPDMIQSILNLGMNRTIVDVFTFQTNNGRWALQTYIKFLRSFGTEVKNIDAVKFTSVIDSIRKRHNPSLTLDTQLSIDELNEIVEKYRLLTNVPDDPYEQLQQAIEAVLKAWNSTKARRFRDIQSLEDANVAITVQSMVFGNQNVLSGTGVAVTRNPTTGKKELFGYYKANAEQGDELLEKKHKAMSLEDLHTEQPEVYQRLMEAVNNLELHFKDAQEMEFTVENLQLFVLEINRAKRSPRASVQIAVDMVQEKILTEREALLRIEPAQMEYFLFPTVVDEFSHWKDAKIKERMLGVATFRTGGAVSGQVAFSPDQAMEIVARNDPCILVLRETHPGQEKLLQTVSGLIIQRAGPTSHGIDTMRSLGKSAVACCPALTLASNGNSMTWCAMDGTEKNQRVCEVITIDGHTGAIYTGDVPTQHVLRDSFCTVMQWADRHKRIGVLATANTQHSLAIANVNGAEGIGLCTADRFFFLPEQLDLMRRFILADTALERSKYLVQMIPQLQKGFRDIFSLTGTCDLSVRLMDCTMGDFLPDPKIPAFEKELKQMSAHLDISIESCRARLQQLFSSNRLLGFHGARLSIVYPEIMEMQVKAIVGAAVELNRRNFIALPQIILPGLVNEIEVERATSIISTVSDNVCAKAWTDSSFEQRYLHSRVGCMLSTPRACVQAANLGRSKHITEVMFDTDVLTSLVMGMDRDDSRTFVNNYMARHIITHDPFVSLDLGGVGSVMQSAVARIRSHKDSAKIKIGVCGEQTSDPRSISYFERLGVDYFSCSPFRIPIVKVAAAQARINADARQLADKAALGMI